MNNDFKICQLSWKSTDKDYIAKSGDLVFRLKYQDIGVYGFGKCYSLQIRKISETEYKYLSYAFIIKSDGYEIELKKSVCNTLWSGIKEILLKTEEILSDNMYL